MFVVFQQPDGVELDHGITGHQLIFYICYISAAPWFGVHGITGYLSINIFVVFQQSHGLEFDHGITGYQLIFYMCGISAAPWFGARPWYYWVSW